VRVAFDTNVLLYAYLDPTSDKGEIADRLISRLLSAAVIPVQVMGETLNVVRRKAPERMAFVRAELTALARVCPTPPTTLDDLLAGERIADRFRLQFWDAVIWAVAVEAGTDLFLTEDLQDGFQAQGVRALNPFASANRAEMALLLG